MSSLRLLRLATFLEGMSLLVLVSVAMPLKYALHYPEAVTVTGSIHGLFFLWFVAVLVHVHLERAWKPAFSLKLLVAAVIPLGFLYAERRLRCEAEGPSPRDR